MDGGAGYQDTRRDRVVADLTLPEALVIWALRKNHQSHHDQTCRNVRRDGPDENSDGASGNLMGLSATFVKVFGKAQLPEAIESFGQLMEAFQKGARCQLRINAYDEECLSIHEEHFLSILAAYQQAEIERAKMLVQWLISSDFDSLFIRQARCFANLLLEAGHSLTGAITEDFSTRVSGKETLITHEHETQQAPYVSRVEELTLGEAVILQGTRRWVACLHQEQEPLPALQAHFAHYGIAGCAAGLNAVLRNIAFAASRMVDVRGSACPNLSPDEADLLHAVAGFQRSDSTPAYDALANWLPPSAIRLSAGALSSLAQSLRGAGLILPLRTRPVYYDSREHHPRSWHLEGNETPGRTLH